MISQLCVNLEIFSSCFSDCQSDAMKLRVCCLTPTRCWGRVQTTFCYQVRSHPPTTNHLRPHQTTLHPSLSTHSTVTVLQGQLLRLSTPGRISIKSNGKTHKRFRRARRAISNMAILVGSSLCTSIQSCLSSGSYPKFEMILCAEKANLYKHDSL